MPEQDKITNHKHQAPNKPFDRLKALSAVEGLQVPNSKRKVDELPTTEVRGRRTDVRQRPSGIRIGLRFSVIRPRFSNPCNPLCSWSMSKAPSSKSQITNKFQIPNSKRRPDGESTTEVRFRNPDRSSVLARPSSVLISYSRL